MLNTMQLDDLPAIIEVINSPLDKFTPFYANNCGYSSSTNDLMVNWVYPLFKKSSYIKAENPNWWQTTNGSFSNEYWKAGCKYIEMS